VHPLGAAVLIAEDHEDSRDALCTLLEAFGYRVHLAANGFEAVAEARAHRPDLILMDMMMPGMDGMEATRTLRSDPDFPASPSWRSPPWRAPASACWPPGCDDWVAKPLDIRAFLARSPSGWRPPPRAPSSSVHCECRTDQRRVALLVRSFEEFPELQEFGTEYGWDFDRALGAVLVDVGEGRRCRGSATWPTSSAPS
jgi:CheY-like chemotaxis protein